ncbi:MAG TPA: STAS domain-containing protein [Pyrinomonadaceae bacterium]|jgi:anti-anti-sigma regulatory factor
MPTRITQVDAPEGAATRLRVEGSLYLADAELLERVCRDIRHETGRAITLDLADLSFLDSDSAAVLSRMRRELGVGLEGLHLFIQKVIELAEEEGRAK